MRKSIFILPLIIGCVLTWGCKKKPACLITKEIYDEYGIAGRTGDPDRFYNHQKDVIYYKYDSAKRVVSCMITQTLYNNDTLVNTDGTVTYSFKYKNDLIERYKTVDKQIADTDFYPLNAQQKIKSFYDKYYTPYHEYNYYYDENQRVQTVKIKEADWTGEDEKKIEKTDIMHYKYVDNNPIQIADTVILADWFFKELNRAGDEKSPVSVVNYTIDYYRADELNAFCNNIYEIYFQSELPGIPSDNDLDTSLPQLILGTPDKLIKSIVIKHPDKQVDVSSFKYKVDKLSNVVNIEKYHNGEKEAHISFEYACN